MRRFYISPRVLWGIAAIILLAGTIITMKTPDGKLLTIGYELAAITFVCAIINIWIAVEHWNTMCGSQLLLADGFVTMFISVLLIVLEATSVNLFPIAFGIWEILSGMFKIAEAVNLNSHKIRGWHRFFGVGLVEMISGTVLLPQVIEDALGMHNTIAAVLMLQFISFIFRIIICPSIINHLEDIIEEYGHIHLHHHPHGDDYKEN